MKEITKIKMIQDIEFEILCQFDKLCRKYHIKYFLNGGTLLGAIRHKGFIPWDDDVDVFIHRKDYERLLRLTKHKKGRYRILSIHNDREYYYAFAKMVDTHTKLYEHGYPDISSLGVYIDIFPIDYVPNNDFLRKWYQFFVFTMRNFAAYGILSEKEKGEVGGLDKVKYRVAQYFSRRSIICMLDRICKNVSKHKTNFSMDLVSAIHPYMKMEDSCFYHQELVEFCGKKFPAPNGYDRYLKALYGEYWKLPPIEKRKSDHSFSAYWRK